MKEERQTAAGGWTPYRPLDAGDKKVFNEGMAGITGVLYLPEQVSTQVVNGINYRFKCKASIPAQPGVWEAIVEMYQSLDGKSQITGIIRL